MNWGTNWSQSKDPRDNLNRDQLLVMWQEAKTKLQTVKEHELELRKYIVKRAFPNGKEGMNTLELGNGYTLKAGVKFNYSLKDNIAVDAGLEKLSKSGNDGSFIAERLISWTPNFLLTEYRQIQKDAAEGNPLAIERLKIIATFLIIKDDAAPSLEIKEPKRKN